MTIYDEIEIEDMDFEAAIGTFVYNCPCGDRFQVTIVSPLPKTLYLPQKAGINGRR
jgi:hypothetical protein